MLKSEFIANGFLLHDQKKVMHGRLVAVVFTSFVFLPHWQLCRVGGSISGAPGKGLSARVLLSRGCRPKYWVRESHRNRRVWLLWRWELKMLSLPCICCRPVYLAEDLLRLDPVGRSSISLGTDVVTPLAWGE